MIGATRHVLGNFILQSPFAKFDRSFIDPFRFLNLAQGHGEFFGFGNIGIAMSFDQDVVSDSISDSLAMKRKRA